MLLMEKAGCVAPARVFDPELAERPKRRRFTAEYKLRILREAVLCELRSERFVEASPAVSRRPAGRGRTAEV